MPAALCMAHHETAQDEEEIHDLKSDTGFSFLADAMVTDSFIDCLYSGHDRQCSSGACPDCRIFMQLLQ